MVKSGETVELIKQEDDGQWWENSTRDTQGTKADILAAVVHSCLLSCRLVRNLSTSKEGTMAAADLMSLIGKSKSCQSLTSSGNPPCYFQRVALEPRVDVLHVTSTLFVISARLSQRAAALGTWAPHPAAARPTQASLTSSPELLHNSHSSKQLMQLSLPGRQHHILLVLNEHRWRRFVWWCSGTWKLQTHHRNCNVVVLCPSAFL